MRLTRIEIHGFKSFADRTQLDLPAGLTAIVGPNGCGKSNVIDAVKWALGEQRASALRGAEMLDVVFKGNGARGPRNFAEVSLVFDNQDGALAIEYSEVVLTRRLFRNGESEYLINRKPVRLKDVRDLLMDTGLGTGAYSVMEQGRIDAVLSANPQERRRIFEEAAGISRYRARKREAESRLERTEQNLVRLGDVLEELERRERSLKQQAGRARAYLQARDRIQLLKSRFYVHQYATFGEQLVRHEQRVEEAREEAQAARQVLEAVRTEVALLQQKLTLARQQVDEVAESFRQASGEVEAITERQSGLRERQREVQERRELLQTRIVGLDAAVAERQRELELVHARVAQLDEDIVAHEAVVVQRRHEHAEVDARVEEARREAEQRRAAVLDRVERLAALRRSRAEQEARRAALGATHDRLLTHVTELGDQKRELAAVQGELFVGARDLDAAHEVARARELACAGRRDASVAQLKALDADLAERREALAGKDSHRRALDELLERHEGVTPGALALLEAGLPGIEGLLVDHLRAPAPLADAVEAALGATTQAVIVASRESGLAALQHLRRVQGGRVLLVPRDGLRPRAGAAAGPRLLDALQLLGHHEVFEALLGHVRLVDDVDALAGCVPDGCTVWVTPGGDLLDERGVLRGGVRTGADDGGLVSRRAERDALAGECELLLGHVGRLGVERTRLAEELQQHEDALGAAQAHARRVDTERDRTRERERQSASRQHAIHREMAVRSADRREVELQLAAVETTLAELVAGEHVLAAEVEDDQQQEGLLDTALHALRDELSSRHEVLAHARTELSARRERREALESERRQVVRGLEERTHDRQLAGAELEALRERSQRSEDELQVLEQRALQLSEERDRRAGALGAAREVAAGLTREQEQVQERVAAAEAVSEAAAGELGTRRLEAQETEIRRDELRRQVLEELQVDLAAPPSVEPSGGLASDDPAASVAAGDGAPTGEPAAGPQPETDWAAVEAEIEELRASLARMGNVNLEAVDELAQVEERLGFLTGQRDDLIEAQRSLIETIQVVNRESRERFETTFAQVQEHFRVIFRKLFRGGRADITLAEGEDVLEAGIDITAAPPGKDSRSISLLSGGERTLTAVGLLFALFRARPSPVCLLDEVDAALDETNIDRFCTVLEDFLGQSQFIVVTHARRTMSYANTVFGVTMQEHGVSKVLGLNLEEYDAQSRRGGALASGPASRQAARGPAPSSAAAGARDAEAASEEPAGDDDTNGLLAGGDGPSPLEERAQLREPGARMAEAEARIGRVPARRRGSRSADDSDVEAVLESDGAAS